MSDLLIFKNDLWVKLQTKADEVSLSIIFKTSYQNVPWSTSHPIHRLLNFSSKKLHALELVKRLSSTNNALIAQRKKKSKITNHFDKNK